MTRTILNTAIDFFRLNKKREKTYDFSAFGDSITAGTKVYPPSAAWANRLGCKKNYAVSGARMRDVMQKIKGADWENRDELNNRSSIIMIGTNDHYRNSQNNIDFFTWRLVYSIEILAKFQSKILVSNIIPMTQTAYSEMDSCEYNVLSYNRGIMACIEKLRENFIGKCDIRLVDNHSKIDARFHLGRDGIHPNTEGHAVIAENFRRELES